MKKKLPKKEVQKNPVGRPTKYKNSFVGSVDKYLETCEDEEVTFQKGYGATDSFQRIVKVKLPTREGFCRFINIGTSTMDVWEDKYPEFRDALRKIDTLQKERLISKGLSGDYNSTIAKLMLSSNHNMIEKKSTDHTTNGKDLPTPILNGTIYNNDSNEESSES